MDMPQVRAMVRYWDRLPPAHIQLARIAASLGIKTETAAEPVAAQHNDQQITEQDFSALAGMFPSAPLPVVMSPEEYMERRNGQQ